MVQARERNILRHLFANGPTSRLQLARLMRLTPNAAGDLASDLVGRGILRECDPSVQGRGRPSIPLEIDPARRHVLGIALQRGMVQVVRLNLRGEVLGDTLRADLREAPRRLEAATQLIAKHWSEDTLAAGLSVTGFVDLEQRRLLLSAALGESGDTDLTPVYDAMNGVPLYVQNDMHALAGRWLLTRQSDLEEDSLLVLLADGQVGSTLLVRGRPNDGCVVAGNELGHMRLPVVTDLCYCGRTGCVERIFSSEYVRARLGLVGSLEDVVSRYDGRRGPLGELIALTGDALANAVNFVRPHRLVLISPLSVHAAFTSELLQRTRAAFLPALTDRVKVELWEQPAASPAETAGFLPLAAMYLDGWA